MESKVLDWKLLCRNAEKFHLDSQRFGELESFYNGLDREAFQVCFCNITNTSYIAKVRSAFPKGELEKLLLLSIVANYDMMEMIYAENQWPQLSFQEISNDLNVWTTSLLRDLGGYGLTPRIFQWEVACLKGEVKQFGRLQCNDICRFEPFFSVYRQKMPKASEKTNDLLVMPAFLPDNPTHPDLTHGDHVINLHIPASGPLDMTECWRSIRRMEAFSAQYHPDYDYKAFVCYSWLLDPQFRQILPSNSNILRFQQMGHVFPQLEVSQTEEVRWRIWGNAGKNCPLEALSENTSMERGVKKFLMDGGEFHEGIMIIFRDEIK